jgi:AraC family transcriptional regulator
MIAALNQLVELIESRVCNDNADPADEPDLAALAAEWGTTEYHLRRMFSTLSGMPVSEDVRRRRMTLAAADIIRGDELLATAVRHGYGSTEAFGRAFRAVHGATPAEIRRDGGPLRAQPHLRFRLTVEGTTPMHARIVDRPAFRLVGHSTRVPLQHRGANPHIRSFIESLPVTEHARLKELGSVEPTGLLQVTVDTEPDAAEGTELTYLHGVAVAEHDPVPDDLSAIDVPAGAWVAFRIEGDYPDALQDGWAATATDWFPSNPWRLRPGPTIVAVLDRSDDFRTAACELWMPVERE